MKFDEIAKELGWIKPYEEVPLWYKEYYEKDLFDGIPELTPYTGIYSIQNVYEDYGNLEDLNKNIVINLINSFNTYLFKEKDINWALPMLASDYFHHKNFGRYKIENIPKEDELKYAKLAIKNNPELTEKSFSHYLREDLKE